MSPMRFSVLAVFCALVVFAQGPRPKAQGPASTAQRQTPIAPTFTRDIAPIVFAKCATCHRPGELAPFSLLTYADAKQHARQIADVTRSRFMPPWKPEHTDFAFAGERRLSDAEIDTIQQWVTTGAPEGDARNLPPAPVFESTWHLGTPDLVLTMPEPFDVPSAGKDVFRNFVIKVPLTSPRYVQALEFRPGNGRVVHHARILVDETDASHWRDVEDPGPGFGGMDAPEAHFPDGHFLGWAPGKLATKESLPWLLAPGTDFVVQMHLRPTGKPERVQATIGLYFSDKPPAAAPVMLRLGSRTIDIPAGAANYQINDSYVLPVDVNVLRIYPHAHYLGKDMLVSARLPDGSTKRLLHIANWDFNWQDEYQYAQPVALPRGTTITMAYTYDNSAANLHNPHSPPVRVRFGPDATDEMGELLLQLVPLDPSNFAGLRNDIGRKVLLGDIAGDEKLVADAPDDAQAHDALGLAYFKDGRAEAALKELNAALAIRPDYPVAAFNLSTIEMLQGQFDPAIADLRKAIAARPDYAEAHNNLGILLMRQAALDPAIVEFREVLRLHPESSDAQYNLGRALLADDKTGEAVAHFRQAIAARPDVPSMLEDLSWILATSTDDSLRSPKEAVSLAERAAELTGRKNASVLDTLGAAYASDGRYEEAATVARQAFDMASDANSIEATEFLKRLDLYRKGQPYREEGEIK